MAWRPGQHLDLQEVVRDGGQRKHFRGDMQTREQGVQVARDEGGVQVAGGEGGVRAEPLQELHVGGQPADLAARACTERAPWPSATGLQRSKGDHRSNPLCTAC